VDRIVSIGAFEHFGFDRYNAFFDRAYELLPPDGIMLLHTIVQAGTDNSACATCRSPCGI